MTIHSNELPTDVEQSDIQAAVDAGLAAALPHNVADDLVVVTVPANGKVIEIDLAAHQDKYADRPRRKKGTVHVQSSTSFVDYIHKHGLDATEVWADPARQGLVGVINAHGHAEGTTDLADEGNAGHGDHRVILELVPTPAWTAWVTRDKQWMDQATFAEHLEDNVLDITHPDAATMLEIAQSFHATTGVAFKSSERLHSGEAALHYEETTSARAGQKGDLEIPTEFSLALQPYAGQTEAVEITARFRYRIRDGHLSLSYALSHTDRILRGLFDEIAGHVDANINQTVFTGRPA